MQFGGTDEQGNLFQGNKAAGTKGYPNPIFLTI